MIMEIIIVLVILVFSFKYIFLNVRVNSVIFGILGIAALYFKPQWFSNHDTAFMLLGLNIIDCIRDIVVYDKYYEHMSVKIDGLYAAKSLCSLCFALIGWFFLDRNLIWSFVPRVVFLVLVYPIQYLTVACDVNTKLSEGHPIPFHYGHYSASKKERYWYKRVLSSLKRNDKIVSNVEIVTAETDTSRNKLARNYPEKLLNKMYMSIFQRKQKKELDSIKNRLSDSHTYIHMAYVSKDYYLKFAEKLYVVLQAKKAVFSPHIIKTFAELKNMNLNYSSGVYDDTEWSKYFIIKILSAFVENGELNDYECSDKPLDNHSYGFKIKSHDASSDPRLALDDD